MSINPTFSRRRFAVGAGATAAMLAAPIRTLAAGSNFKVGVISDEISQDFDHACFVIAKDFGLHYVELREMWGKNLQVISDAQIGEAQKIIARYGLQVTDIGSPLYKVDWPGAPHSQYGSKARPPPRCGRGHLQEAGGDIGAVYFAGQAVQDG